MALRKSLDLIGFNSDPFAIAEQLMEGRKGEPPKNVKVYNLEDLAIGLSCPSLRRCSAGGGARLARVMGDERGERARSTQYACKRRDDMISNSR